METFTVPHPVDVHVGARIRSRRKIIGQGQVSLADQLGLTFQQVQKYERGANRVSASKLWDIARAQDVPISYYFEGLPDEGAAIKRPSLTPAMQQAVDWLNTGEALDWAVVVAPMAKAVQASALGVLGGFVRAIEGLTNLNERLAAGPTITVETLDPEALAAELRKGGLRIEVLEPQPELSVA